MIRDWLAGACGRRSRVPFGGNRFGEDLLGHTAFGRYRRGLGRRGFCCRLERRGALIGIAMGRPFGVSDECRLQAVFGRGVCGLVPGKVDTRGCRVRCRLFVFSIEDVASACHRRRGIGRRLGRCVRGLFRTVVLKPLWKGGRRNDGGRHPGGRGRVSARCIRPIAPVPAIVRPGGFDSFVLGAGRLASRRRTVTIDIRPIDAVGMIREPRVRLRHIGWDLVTRRGMASDSIGALAARRLGRDGKLVRADQPRECAMPVLMRRAAKALLGGLRLDEAGVGDVGGFQSSAPASNASISASRLRPSATAASTGSAGAVAVLSPIVPAGG